MQEGVLKDLICDLCCGITEVGLNQLLNTTQHCQPHQKVVLIPLYSDLQVVKAYKGGEPIRFTERFGISNGLNLVSVVVLFRVEIACLNDSWTDIQINPFCFALFQLDVSSVIDVRLYELSTILGVSVGGLIEQLNSVFWLLKEVVSLISSGTSFSLNAAFVDFVIKSQFCKISSAFTLSYNSLISFVHTIEQSFSASSVF